jgi:hypothetical protein
MTSDVQSVIHGLIGQRCEGVDNPYGSILRLDIGPLGRRADDSTATPPHGWRHLTVLSPWRLESASEVIADWNLSGGFEGVILGRVKILIGLTVVAASSQPPGWDLVLSWSSGLHLRVFSDRTQDRDDAWAILGTDGLELGVGPAKQGDAGYQLTWTRRGPI